MKRNRKEIKKNREEDYFLISLEKKKKILGFFIVVFATLVLLSVVSYSDFDQANLSLNFSDIFKVFSSNPEDGSILRAKNWLGIFGAYISNFLVNSTLGYFSIVFPGILFLFGWSIARDRSYYKSVVVSNSVLGASLVLASFFGVLRFELGFLDETNVLTGAIGNYLGAALCRLLGFFGALTFISASAFILLFILFDVRPGKAIEFLKRTSLKIIEWLKEKISELTKEPQKETIKTKAIRENAALRNIEDKKEPCLSQPTKAVVGGEPEERISKDADVRIIRSRSEDPIIDKEDSLRVVFKEETENKEKSKKEEELNDEMLVKAGEKDAPEQWQEEIIYEKPKLSFLQETTPEEETIVADDELKQNADLLKEKLKLFDIDIEDISVIPGPVVTLYEIKPAPGIKISKIVNLEDDIAMALAAKGIRIIAPIPGKSAIGVEIPNNVPAIVKARQVLSKVIDSKAELPLALGKTISGEIYIADLTKMPHLLIAGSTGSGKSVGINMIIASALYSKHPSEVKFVIIDPKKIELSFYKSLRNHFLAVSPDIDEEIVTTPQNAVTVLKSVELEMDKRYDKLAKIGARNIVEYNDKISDPKIKSKDPEGILHHKMPYIIVIIDELADLMMTASKEVEEPIARLAQMARAVGIHLTLATQRPSVNVITGVIKANFPARIAYQVASKIDSRTILDMNGAEQLLGRGDMLFLPGGNPKPIRIQNAYISTDEVEKIVNGVYIQKGFSKRFLLPSTISIKKPGVSGGSSDLDAMFEEAAKLIVRHQQASVSLLQRKLKLGYGRAARIMDQLEECGVVGPLDANKTRQVIIDNDEQLENIFRTL